MNTDLVRVLTAEFARLQDRAEQTGTTLQPRAYANAAVAIMENTYTVEDRVFGSSPQ